MRQWSAVLRRWIAGVGAAALLAAGAATGGASGAAAQERPRPIVGGWLGWWASDAAVNRIIEQADGAVPEVNVFWWFFAGRDKPLCTYDRFDGGCVESATPWTNATLNAQRQRMQAAGVKVLASITDLGPTYAGQLSPYLAQESDRVAYAAQIADWAQKAGVDGVDLDWENFAFRDGSSTWATTKPRWVAFLRELSSALRSRGLLLSATVPGGVPPFRSDGTANPGTGYWVYAWSDIIGFVDRLRIMAYDYSWTYPGPIGPNDWAGEVVRSAVSQVGAANAGKVWIGVPQYGRNWVRRTDTGGYLTKDCPASWTPNSDLIRTTPTPEVARALADRESATINWDDEAGEWWFRYSTPTAGTVANANGGRTARTCEARREVWFADTRSALARASLVPEYKIGGIAVWNLQDVPADFFGELAAYAVSVAPKPTSVSVRAPRIAQHGRTVPVRVSATSAAEVPAGARVAVLWSATAEGPRVRVATGVLDSAGAAVLETTATKSGYWWASVSGSWARRSGSASIPAQTRVRYAVTAQASDTTPNRGQEVRISALAAPAVPGTAVQLQKQVAGKWTTIRALTMSRGGGASARVTPRVAKDLAFRFVIAPSDGLVRTVSPLVTLSVG